MIIASLEEHPGNMFFEPGLWRHPYYRSGDCIHHSPHDEHLLVGLQDLIGDVSGSRAADDHAYPDEGEHQAVGGLVPPQDVMEERSRPQPLIIHHAAVHEEEPYGPEARTSCHSCQPQTSS